jgi:hypothetical protein
VTQAGLIAPRPCTHLPHVPVRCSTATVTPQPPTLNNKITTVKNLLPPTITTLTGSCPARPSSARNGGNTKVFATRRACSTPSMKIFAGRFSGTASSSTLPTSLLTSTPPPLRTPTPSSPEARFSSEPGSYQKEVKATNERTIDFGDRKCVAKIVLKYYIYIYII